MPETNYWEKVDNPVEKMFWGRIELEAAASFLFFEKGAIAQNLIHHLKYKGKSEIGLHIGYLFGNKLKCSVYNEIDAIVPVPLHPFRKATRGFNQSEMIAQGIGKALQKPVISDAVVRLKKNRSQTSKGRYSRWLNSEGIFSCTKPEQFDAKHILLVDDIITTGATIESLASTIKNESKTKISVVALASA